MSSDVPAGTDGLERVQVPRMIGGRTLQVPMRLDPVTGEQFLTPDAARLLFEVEQAFGQGLTLTPTHHFALEPGQSVIMPEGTLRLISFSEHEGAAAFEFEQLGEESPAHQALRALRNVRLMANRQLFLAERGRLLRPEAWKDVKRFCAEAGVVDSPLRAEASAKVTP